MNSVGLVQPSGYNRSFVGETSIDSGKTIGDPINLCGDSVVDAQSQGHSKWKIYKKPKLRKKSVDDRLTDQIRSTNVADGHDTP